MSTSNYAGAAPVNGVWALDDGLQLRYYTSTALLGLGFSAGYAMPAAIGAQRRPSLQWFGADGYCDASVFIGTPLADNLPNDLAKPAALEAYERFLRGEPSDWIERGRSAARMKTDHRRELVSRINLFRSSNLRPVY